MISPDTVNGGFELFGAVLTWKNFTTYCKDRDVSGVYWPGTGFWVAWGVWNLYYYTALDQPLSFLGGIALTGGSAAWLAFVALDKWIRRMDRKINKWSVKPESSWCHACETWGYDHRGFCDEEGSRSSPSTSRSR